MSPRRERRPPGRPRSRKDDTDGIKVRRRRPRLVRPKSPRRTAVRADRRNDVFRRQASQGLAIDDLEHGDSEVPLHLLSKGRVVKRYVQCGKERCRCRTGGRRHGPYNYLVINIPVHMRRPKGPRQRWYYLTEEEAQRFRTRIRNFHILVKNMLADMWEELDIE